MKIIAFGASNSKNSINQQFAKYAANQFENSDIEIISLNDYPLPIYSADLEQEQGIPENVVIFYQKLQEADLLVISLAEHNGTYTVAFKNLFDWVSRYQLKMFENKKLLLLSTAPGGRGGLGTMEAALVRFPIHGAEIVGKFSLPFFQKNFDKENGILDPDLQTQFREVISQVKSKI